MSDTAYEHTPVLLDEVINGLNVRSGGCYFDCTLGRGGHSLAIMQHLNQHGRLYALDKDPRAGANLPETLASDRRFHFSPGSFTQIGKLASELLLKQKVDGILFDLGVSSPQLDDATRGFSFMKDGPLDMRMDDSSGMTVAEWLNKAGEFEIARVLREYGEERYYRKIARAIINQRKIKNLQTTGELVELVKSVVPTIEKNRHPATRTFQALRIRINNELDDLHDALDQVINILAAGGRLVVISFHSLEDRIVKRFIREQSRGDDFPVDLPVKHSQLNPRLKIIGRAVYPSEEEIRNNPRSRSAVMRVAERLTV